MISAQTSIHITVPHGKKLSHKSKIGVRFSVPRMFYKGDNMLIDELVEFSNHYGSNPSLVLAGGGNTSAKENGRMWVKGSGTALATITAQGFVEMDLEKLNSIFSNTYPDSDTEREAAVLDDLMAARVQGEEKRPSVETTLHGLFPHRFVLHLHPSKINGLTCSKGGESAAKKVINRDFIWIEQCRPGYILAKLCRDKLNEYKAAEGKDCDMLLLENHGIFIAADTVSELGEKLEFVLHSIDSALKEIPSFDRTQTCDSQAQKALLSAFPEGAVIKEVPCGVSRSFVAEKSAAWEILRPFTPDHIVYCKAYPLWLESLDSAKDEVELYRTKYGFLPRVVLLEGRGVFCIGDSLKQANTAEMLFEDAADIAVYARSFGGASHMTQELTDFITNWEVEAYRSSQNA